MSNLRTALLDELDAPGTITKSRLRNLLIKHPETGPRTITTVEELDTLPAGAVVLSEGYFEDWPTAFQRWGDGLWYRGGRSRDTHPDYFLPATVVHEVTA